MKKLIGIALSFILFMVAGCSRDTAPDYSSYIQMNEEFTINEVQIKVTRCYINEIDNIGMSEEKIITIEVQYLNNKKIKSSDVKLLANKKELSFYTVDGLDYLNLDDANPRVRFKVENNLNDFIMKIVIENEIKEIYVFLEK